MSEREPQNHEALTPSNSAELEQIAEANRETASERAESGENQAEQLESARAKIEQQPEEQPAFEERTHTPKPHPTGLDKATAYRQTLHSLQQRLRPASRSFSQFIHNPSVEKTSEVIGNTVLRPSVTLGATLTALIVGGTLYLTAQHYGFALRGSELILGLIAGGIIGVVIEFIVKALRGFKK